MLTWVDEGRDAGGDAVTPHYIQHCHAFVLEERDSGEDGIGEGRVEEADEYIGLYIARSLGEWTGHIKRERKSGPSQHIALDGVWRQCYGSLAGASKTRISTTHFI